MKEFKKITEEEWLDSNYKLNLLPNNVKEMFQDKVSSFSNEILERLYECESPIEQMLYIEMKSVFNSNIWSTINNFVDVLGIEPQFKIKCKENNYRVDFAIIVEFKSPFTNNLYYKVFVVECDGHEFHEKTKQQVIKDNERTRDLQKNGYEVIRFSGSEIFEDVKGCTLKIFEIIYSYFWEEFVIKGGTCYGR